MKLNIKGRQLLLSESKNNNFFLININKDECNKIKEMINLADSNLPYDHIETELGLTIDQVIAFGDGNPSHHTIAKFILPINKHDERNIYPCYCGHDIDPIKREKERLDPILHADCESSFICARERLSYPDYCLILKVSKNGKEDKATVESNRKEE